MAEETSSDFRYLGTGLVLNELVREKNRNFHVELVSYSFIFRSGTTATVSY